MRDYTVKEILNKSNKELNLYSLQLANMIRIRENDAVYIFDEVGTGKTISAGLSIIELIFNNDGFKDVLIITNNSVVEPFRKKLKETLKLNVSTPSIYDRNANYNIKIINNLGKNIAKEVSNKYDFIIVDEAHDFLKEDNDRHKEILRLKSKKIMFLTATPIKNNRNDLKIYAKIAANVIKNKEHSDDFEKEKNKLEEELMWATCDPEELCTTFNPYSPVTRYFKDISRNLIIEYDTKLSKYETKYSDKPPIRLKPQVWDAEHSSKKYRCIFENISDVIAKNPDNSNNKFIIFTWFNDDIEKIASEFSKSDIFEEYNQSSYSKNTYLKLYGGLNDKVELSKIISSTEEKIELPTVIITNQKTSEVGLDFPRYNYVINYHINPSASSTEQRFGRIDRMNSKHEEINMCFIISSKTNDTNNNNFYNSMIDYIYEMLICLPCKNVLITDETPKLLKDNTENLVKFYENEEKNCTEENIEIIREKFKNEDHEYWHTEDGRNLYNFVDRNRKLLERYFEESDENKYVLDKIKKKVSNDKQSYERKIKRIEELEECLKDTKGGISNKILYSLNNTDKRDFHGIGYIDAKAIHERIGNSKKYNFFKNKIIDLLN